MLPTMRMWITGTCSHSLQGKACLISSSPSVLSTLIISGQLHGSHIALLQCWFVLASLEMGTQEAGAQDLLW